MEDSAYPTSLSVKNWSVHLRVNRRLTTATYTTRERHLAMAAFRSAFGAAGGSTSWADDDDVDTTPLPIPSTLPKVSEQEPVRPESPRSERKYSNDYHERDYDRRGGRGGYDDRGSRGDRAPRSGYDGERPKNPVPDRGPYKAFLGNLSFRLNEHDLVDFLGSPETVTDVRIQRDRDTDRPKGFAYVEFRDRDALVAALELDGKNLDGRAIRIDVAAEKERKSNFFEKRGDRPDRGDRPERGDRGRFERRGDDSRSEQPRERPRLTLAPRTAAPASDDQKPAQKASIFGEAKPRDENAFWERKKAKDAELKKEREAAKKAAPRERKVSHDDTDGKPQGKVRGGRGDRGERADRGGRGGRGAAPASEAPAKETKEPKEEPKPKVVEPKLPKATKLPAPPSTKTKNVFSLLGDDSDSD